MSGIPVPVWVTFVLVSCTREETGSVKTNDPIEDGRPPTSRTKDALLKSIVLPAGIAAVAMTAVPLP